MIQITTAGKIAMAKAELNDVRASLRRIRASRAWWSMPEAIRRFGNSFCYEKLRGAQEEINALQTEEYMLEDRLMNLGVEVKDL